MKLIYLAAAYAFAVSAAGADPKEDYARPLDIPFPEGAPYDPQIATLGKMLYFDPRLSGGQNLSCASCHNPSFGWETPVKRAIGASGAPLARHAPTVLNMAWVSPYFWDGRADTLEAQAEGPITNPDEMNAEMEEVVARLSDVEDYDRWFTQLFPQDGLSAETVLTAIATYERTIVSGWSPFDRWVDGEETAISEQAKRGFELFNGRAGCNVCHSGWNMTDNGFHDIGLYTEDPGRGVLDPDDPTPDHAFKTPGLRNISLRAPYMHAGQLDTLEEVIAHYATGGEERPTRSLMMEPFELEEGDMEALVAFLNTLTEEETWVPTPVLPTN